MVLRAEMGRGSEVKKDGRRSKGGFEVKLGDGLAVVLLKRMVFLLNYLKTINLHHIYFKGTRAYYVIL